MRETFIVNTHFFHEKRPLMENSHEYLHVTYWENVLNFCSGRNIKTLDFDFLLTLISISSLNRHVQHTCSLVLMVENINFKIGEKSEVSDIQ
jgi:hypothetical protein